MVAWHGDGIVGSCEVSNPYGPSPLISRGGQRPAVGSVETMMMMIMSTREFVYEWVKLLNFTILH